mgnify:CR=1 FL=1
MALDNFGEAYTQEQVEKYGKRLLDKYGLEVCEAAAVLDEQNLKQGTTRSYKPQVRQILHGLSDTNPTPRGVVDHISEVDKQSGTKKLMVSAMEKYFKSIGEQSKGTEVRDLANKEGITDKNFNTESTISGWITKDEILTIEQQILPSDGEKTNILSFEDRSWAITAEHKALTMCLYYTACRVGEICKRSKGDEALSVEDIDLDSNKIELYRLKKKGKGYKRDITAVPDKLINALEEYINMYNIQSGPIFSFTTRTAQNRIKDISKVYKHAFGDFEHMDKLTPHKFRHGRITDIANNSSLEDAGQYVDHASPETTNQYRHVATEEQREMLPEESGGTSDAQALSELMDKLDVDSIEEALDEIESSTEE